MITFNVAILLMDKTNFLHIGARMRIHALHYDPDMRTLHISYAHCHAYAFRYWM